MIVFAVLFAIYNWLLRMRRFLFVDGHTYEIIEVDSVPLLWCTGCRQFVRCFRAEEEDVQWGL